MSIKFLPVILGPEMTAPILWAPGIFWFFLLENPHAHKIPPFRGGGCWGFLEGGVEVPILFLWAWGFFRSMTIKFGKFANFIVRNFVVIWEAPTFCAPGIRFQFLQANPVRHYRKRFGWIEFYQYGTIRQVGTSEAPAKPRPPLPGKLFSGIACHKLAWKSGTARF